MNERVEKKLLEQVKKAVEKVEKAAERNGINIDLIEIREGFIGPYDEYFAPTASVYAGREILVYTDRGENIYLLLSKHGDNIKRYKVAAAALAAAQKLDIADGEL